MRPFVETVFQPGPSLTLLKPTEQVPPGPLHQFTSLEFPNDPFAAHRIQSEANQIAADELRASVENVKVFATGLARDVKNDLFTTTGLTKAVRRAVLIGSITLPVLTSTVSAGNGEPPTNNPAFQVAIGCAGLLCCGPPLILGGLFLYFNIGGLLKSRQRYQAQDDWGGHQIIQWPRRLK